MYFYPEKISQTEAGICYVESTFSICNIFLYVFQNRNPLYLETPLAYLKKERNILACIEKC